MCVALIKLNYTLNLDHNCTQLFPSLAVFDCLIAVDYKLIYPLKLHANVPKAHCFQCLFQPSLSVGGEKTTPGSSLIKWGGGIWILQLLGREQCLQVLKRTYQI